MGARPLPPGPLTRHDDLLTPTLGDQQAADPGTARPWRLGIEQLPETLGEAIELTAESELVLRTFGEHIFNRYVEIKRQEWEDYRVQVTQWELDRYLAVL